MSERKDIIVCGKSVNPNVCSNIAFVWTRHQKAWKYWLSNNRTTRTIRDLMLAGFCCLAMIGCDVTRPVGPVDEKKPVAPVVVRDDVWANIALAIEKGEVTSSTKLVLMVNHLRAVNKITEADVTAVSSLFSDWDKKEFSVGKSEADRILTLPELKVQR